MSPGICGCVLPNKNYYFEMVEYSEVVSAVFVKSHNSINFLLVLRVDYLIKISGRCY